MLDPGLYQCSAFYEASLKLNVFMALIILLSACMPYISFCALLLKYALPNLLKLYGIGHCCLSVVEQLIGRKLEHLMIKVYNPTNEINWLQKNPRHLNLKGQLSLEHSLSIRLSSCSHIRLLIVSLLIFGTFARIPTQFDSFSSWTAWCPWNRKNIQFWIHEMGFL